MAEQRTDLGADSHDNIVVQIEGDQNTVQIGLRPKLLLTRFVAQRRIPAGKAVSELLQLSPYTLSTTLVGRDAELADLDRFLHSTESISVRVLTGDGGSGKTRLALHLCEQMADQGWLTGFATSDALRRFNAQPDRTEWGWSRPTLVVIDYAASHTELLKDWLDALADRLGQEPALEHPLRILLLERHATHESGWMAELCASGGWASIGGRHQLFDPPEPVAVLPLIDPADRASLLNQMLQRNGFSGPQVSPEFVDQHLSAASWGRDPLFLMMAALHAVQQGRIEALALHRTDLAQKLAMREGARLDRLAAAHQPAPLNKQLLRHLSACITLAQGMDRDAFLPLVSQESQATGRPSGGDPAELHDLLADALPPTDDGHLPPLLPDLIGEAFVLNTLAAQRINAAGLQRLYATLGLPMVQTLVRCAQDFAKQDTDLPLPWLQALVQAASGDWQRLGQIDQAMPNGSVVLRRLNLEIAELRGKALTEWPEASAALKARHLSQACIARAEMGQREEALEAAREAVEIYRELARQRPDAFRPDLATSLSTVSSRLSALGRQEEALKAAREALEIRRMLTRQRPDIFRPDLAMSLSNMAIQLGDLGQREEALKAAREAVEIRRKLAQQRPDVFSPELAFSLNNVAIRLSDLGQREEALEAAREAVEIRRGLAWQRPDAFRSDLANSLNNVSSFLIALGQGEEALEAAREAVNIYRELAQQHPDAFRSDLADSLNNVAGVLGELDQREEALEAGREALEIRRMLTGQRPDVFRPDLAMSLNNVAIRLSDLGQREEALEAARESVEIYRELARHRPGIFHPGLAMSLNNVANRLSDLGQREDALDAAREAVEIYRELTQHRPDAFRPDLARSLAVMGLRLEEAGAPMAQCVSCFAEALATLTPAFLRYPAGLMSLMGYLIGAYEEKAQTASIEPDMALLTPILEVMQRLQPSPEHQGEPT